MTLRLASAAIVLTLICSCRTARHITDYRTASDTIMTARIYRDSIYISDSTILRTRNDTVFVDRIRYVGRYRTATDTVMRHSRDTVYRTVQTQASALPAASGLRRTLTGAAALLALILVLILAIRKA